ncbi:MAG TPA: sigma 54-interacting transcriptional regulator [Acidobacteriota bacterium]|nr:sigma 54-interacting transcriptional regulator [Acidobacteriota bacterium]
MSTDKSTLYETLFEFSRAISGHNDLDSLCRAMAGSLQHIIHFDLLALLLYNEANNTLRMHGLTWDEKIPEEAYRLNFPIDGHPAGWVWTNQQSLYIPRLDQETRWPDFLEKVRSHGFSSIFLVPLTTGNRRLGVLAFTFFSASSASDEEMAFINRAASELSVTIESFLVKQQYLQQRDRLQLLFDVTNALVSKLSAEELIPVLAEQLSNVISTDFAILTLLDGKTGELVMRSVHIDGMQRDENEPGRIHPEGLPSAEAMATGRPVLMNTIDFDRFPSPYYRHYAEAGFRSSCSIPLISPNSTLGTLELARRSGRPFSADDVELIMQIGRQIALALENALAYRELSEMKERLAVEKLYLENEIIFDRNIGEMLGESPAFQSIVKNIQIVAPTDATVLILGETGTGKELVARAIHQKSLRCSNNFVKLNCAAIPSSLLESELFGHEKGAFTGALNRRIGRFELADKGTLFLDEVGEIPLELQSKLLRAIQEQEFERLGGNRTIKVDVRLVAASNRNLKAMVAAGEFRSDLYYRLHVIPIAIPPLRERREDIPLLTRYFTQKYAQRAGRRFDTIPSDTMRFLISYQWPGNIRELQNIIERSVILSRGQSFELAMPEMAAPSAGLPSALKSRPHDERKRILQALEEANGVVSGLNGAAGRLGLKRTTLQARMKKLGINRNYQ